MAHIPGRAHSTQHESGAKGGITSYCTTDCKHAKKPPKTGHGFEGLMPVIPQDMPYLAEVFLALVALRGAGFSSASAFGFSSMRSFSTCCFSSAISQLAVSRRPFRNLISSF